MHKSIQFVSFFLLTLGLIVACKKNAADMPLQTTGSNKPPIAVAGSDQVITLPVDSTELIGMGTDPDGNIDNYRWSKVSGPSVYNIVSPHNASTKIKNLVRGLYVFELRVTDIGGLFGNDSIIVVVDSMSNDPCKGCWDY